MDLLTISSILLSLVGALILKALGSELVAWTPTFARKIVDCAVARLPADERDRYREEWLAHLDESPGSLSKLYHALGCFVCSTELARLAILQREAGNVPVAVETAKETELRDALSNADRLVGTLLARLEIKGLPLELLHEPEWEVIQNTAARIEAVFASEIRFQKALCGWPELRSKIRALLEFHSSTTSQRD